MRQITACLASAAIAASATLVAAPAFAADDMGSNPITELFDAFGMGDREKPEIEYKERAPLVPPPSTAALPAPQAKGAIGRDSGMWPNDPDEERRAQKRAAANRLPTETNSYRMDRSPRLDPDEIGDRRVRGANVPDRASGTRGDNEITRMERSDLESQRLNRGPQPVAGSEPTRGRLTDPPPGYRVGTGGVTAAAAPEQKPWYKRMFGN
jgi:hypothetical protein